MDDQLDVTLEDGDLLAEVELTARLMVATNASDHVLSPQEIDRVLGVERPAAIPSQARVAARRPREHAARS